MQSQQKKFFFNMGSMVFFSLFYIKHQPSSLEKWKLYKLIIKLSKIKKEINPLRHREKLQKQENNSSRKNQ
jgi:hypothetical protein